MVTAWNIVVWMILFQVSQADFECSDENVKVSIKVLGQFCDLQELNDLIEMSSKDISMCCTIVSSLTDNLDCVEAANCTRLMQNWGTVCTLPSMREEETPQDQQLLIQNQEGVSQNKTQPESPRNNFININDLNTLEVDNKLVGGYMDFRSARQDIQQTYEEEEEEETLSTTILTTPPPNNWQQIISSLRSKEKLALSAVFLSKLNMVIPDQQRITIIAPVDDAYIQLANNLNISFWDLEKLNNWEDILRYHIVLGEVPVLEIVDRGTWLGTLSGHSLWVQRSILTGQVVVVGCCDPENIARIILPDERLNNGNIVQIVDNVLLPQGSAFDSQSVVFGN
eukprot:TRINITY_DN6087_c0_g2_i5.p1 TRINITY_DN6087_c0_g2~~TRINITY_DN6087_c0_g2_i5.p1  ORF type:complete len:398 (+),score=32.00 TRINITY_DN6087_c0_g2_i5:178-1194(+)